jgi:hypothetical protein
VAGVIEFLRNAALLRCHGFGSATFFPSGTGSNKAGLGSFPNEVSLKLRQCAEDMKDQLSPAGGGINVLRQALKPNAPFLKVCQGGNQMRKEAPRPV